MIKHTKAVLAGAALLLASFQASAAYMSYDFSRLTDNGNGTDLGDQLLMTVWDWTEANSTFAGQTGYVDLLAGQVFFTFENDVGDASNIAEIYFDDGFFGSSTVYNSLGTGDFTNFTGGGAIPGNLPGANLADPDFVATQQFSADAAGNPVNGVDNTLDIVGLMFNLGTFADYDAVVTALNSEALRVGLHVRSIGVPGGSDSYINNPPGGGNPPMPVPGTLLLMGLGLITLAGMRRRI